MHAQLLAVDIGLQMGRVRNDVWYATNRSAILEEAARLFRQRGYENTTISSIADQLGLSKAAIYYYFSTKEALLLEICETAVTDALVQMSTPQFVAMPELDRLHYLLLNHFNCFSMNTGAFTVFIQELWTKKDKRARSIRRKQKQFQDGVKNLIASGQTNGVFRITDPTLTTFAILGMCHWAYQWMPTSSHKPQEIATAFMDLLAYGLVVGPNASPVVGQPSPNDHSIV